MTLTLEICINTLHANFLLWTREVASNSNIRGGGQIGIKSSLTSCWKYVPLFSMPQLPCLHLTPLKGFLSWHSALQKGPRLASCIAPGATEEQGHRLGLSRTSIANLECAFVKKPTLLFVAPKIGEGGLLLSPLCEPSTWLKDLPLNEIWCAYGKKFFLFLRLKAVSLFQHFRI